VELVKKLAPIAKEIADLLTSMSAVDAAGALKSVPSAAVPSQPADNKVEAASNSTTVAERPPTTSPLPADQKAAVPEPAPAKPEVDSGSPPPEHPTPTSTDASGDSAASPAPTDSPTDAPDVGAVQRRDLPTSASTPAPTPTPSSTPGPNPNRKE
jgi:hypothetical protein